jgi:hypothetical protein
MPQSVYKELKYDFSEGEIHDLSIELANKTKELKQVTEEKKASNSTYTVKINGIKKDCDLLSNQVSDGFEYRAIACEVEYHKPLQGQKTLTRTDTGEVFTESMDEEDWNLFNQY